jgi:hypothetical protein
MKLSLIACEVLYRELCGVIARSPHQVDLGFLPKGLHDIGSAGMLERLQATVDAVDESRYDAILLGYALCNNGIAGLRARSIPLVVPRGHDCMTMFFGSRAAYQNFFDANPGTYFLTSGWLERGEAAGELQQLSIQQQTGMTMSYEELVQKYGEDNAAFLYDQLCNHTRHYRRITYIRMGIEPDPMFEEQARARARERGWEFTSVPGSMNLIERLINGPWDDDGFLVVPPRHRIIADYSESIIHVEPDTA